MKGRSGGFRAGAGRKPIDRQTLALRGGQSRRASAVAVGPLEPVESVSVPVELDEAQRAVWDALAPHATRARTLTPETEAAFRDLCEATVLKRAMLARILADGMMLEDVSVDGAGVEHRRLQAHPLIAKHQAMMVRVEAAMSRFLLAPQGRPAAVSEPKPDEWAEFEARPRLVARG